MISIPAGEFFMGCNPEVDDQCQPDEKPGRKVYLDAFRIDRTEVTVAQYARCVKAGQCTPPDTETTCNWGKEGRARHPVNCVDWHQAQAYCAWAGKRLPTAAQWEKAARGADGRKYPWGNQDAGCERAVMIGKETGCDKRSTWPVCSKPEGNSAYGLCDMAGNVWEWVADWYRPGAYQSADKKNPAGPSFGVFRAVRGGSWFSTPEYLRASNRDRDPPKVRHDVTGFRCVRGGP